MNKRCLCCKQKLSAQNNSRHSMAYCSEFCFAQGPGATSSSKPNWTRSNPQNLQGQIQRILKKNHDILSTFGGRHQQRVFSDVGGLHWLKSQGYDFDYHTHTIPQADGRTEVWCYDQGYRIDAQGRIEPLC